MADLGATVTILDFGSCRLLGALEDSSSDELLGSASLDTMAFLRRVIGPGDGFFLASRFGFSSFPLGRALELPL